MHYREKEMATEGQQHCIAALLIDTFSFSRHILYCAEIVHFVLQKAKVITPYIDALLFTEHFRILSRNISFQYV